MALDWMLGNWTRVRAHTRPLVCAERSSVTMIYTHGGASSLFGANKGGVGGQCQSRGLLVS